MARQLKNTLIYYSTRAAVAFVGMTPKGLVAPLGRAFGGLAHRVAGRERDLARQQLARALERPERSKSVALLTRGVFDALGESAVELCRMVGNSGEPPPVVIPDAARRCLDEALEKGRGVVFVTGHIGNWELMAISLAEAGYPISTVAKESYDERFTRLIERHRRAKGVEAIYRGRPGAAAAMLRVLRDNRVLGFLIDQDTRVESAFVPFFGRAASTPVGAAAFAMRTDAPVVVGTISRNPQGTHTVNIEACPMEEDVTASTAALTRALENRIRRHPSQWVWFHKRWRTRPGGEVSQ